MDLKPRLAVMFAVIASLIAVSASTRAQDRPAPILDPCCCDPLPEQLEEDSSARAAMITGGTFIAVGWAVSVTYGVMGSSVTNRFLGFIPLAGPLAIATNLDARDNTAAVGALIFAVWAQAVGAMVLAIGGAQHRRAVADPRVSFGGAPTPDGVVGSVAVRF